MSTTYLVRPAPRERSDDPVVEPIEMPTHGAAVELARELGWFVVRKTRGHTKIVWRPGGTNVPREHN